MQLDKVCRIKPNHEHQDPKDEQDEKHTVPLAGTDLGDLFLGKTLLHEVLFQTQYKNKVPNPKLLG